MKVAIRKNRVWTMTLIVIVLIACKKGGTIGGEDDGDPEGPDPVVEEALAFPGAEGFGRDATGGRGGKVLFVTKLTDDGTPGTLRHAINQSGARYILFKVAGNIALTSPLRIRNGDVTIAGQTAPGDGICIQHYPVIIQADNVIIRFMRFRMGDRGEAEGDALEARGHKHIIVDHCSMSWSTDECVSMYNNEYTTLQWCIISESLRNSVHEKGAHGYGGIWGGRYASFHHNLLAHHDSRNPRLGETAGSAFALTNLTDIRNNVVYNWDGNSMYGGEAMNVNIVNNYYKPGPATRSSRAERIISIDKNNNEGTEVYGIWGKFYIDGNHVDGSARATADNWTHGVYNQFHSRYVPVSESDKAVMRRAEPHVHHLGPHNGVETQAATAAYEAVLSHAGASLKRDALDVRVVDDVRRGVYTHEGSRGSTNGIIDSQDDVGGWPILRAGEYPPNQSGDGIADDWKRAKGLDPAKFQANGRDLSTAYDNLEVYINSLVEEVMKR
ncbi:Pectate lyase [Parapedobacter composti]|uniref:Pectate lyase n=2 Tax=Parapedobacter composti TaxID=623281 RepID=A0A1I1I4K2_9SPHI|nr:Pectate lyase [Parapedobacter composti]